MSAMNNQSNIGRSKWAKEAVRRIEKNERLTIEDIKEIEKSVAPRSSSMDLPDNIHLPLFVYGALKPCLPGYQCLRQFVGSSTEDAAPGELYVRDGLPLLRVNEREFVEGWLLRWENGREEDAYSVVCDFEPRKHYKWEVVTLQSGQEANVLVIRHERKGSPHHLSKRTWSLEDDPAFGPGLDEVERMLEEVDEMPGDRDDFESNWKRFFRAQMGYLLLWSILERLSAFCIGPNFDPMERIKRMPTLPGMAEAVKSHVKRESKISDSRDPDNTYLLDATDAKKSLLYYYQLRSNLSHRGKGVFQEFDLVRSSLRELLGITREYLRSLNSLGESDVLKKEPPNSRHQIYRNP